MLASTSPPLTTDLADIFPTEAILIGLQHRAKAGVIAELVHRLVETGRIAPEAEQSLIETIVARETMGSTALGNGVAFPHCRSSATESFVGAIGVDFNGVAFNAVDSAPVQVVFLLIGPLTKREQHFEVLARINSIGRSKAIRLQLAGCRSADRVNLVIRDCDLDRFAFKAPR
jgi:mannitol/fructose-specific phosphotransferase system IIA component (Ntr-type)